MRYSRVLGVLLVAVASCDSDGVFAPPSGLRHSAAMRSCGPTDGAAVAIYLLRTATTDLSPAPLPHVRIAIHQGVSEIERRGWDVSHDSQHGIAVFVDNTSAFQPASRGVVIINNVLSDTTIEGSVDLVFPEAGRVRGGFRARWMSASPPLLCG
jgi:hypothetical protein